MHPLYDNHGRGGRQICVRGGPKGSNGNQRNLRLAWGHSLCCYYLAKNGFLYSIGPNGENNFEEEDDITPDLRPPNVTSILTNEFRTTVRGGARPVTAFRYYLPDPSASELDRYRHAIDLYKSGIQCTICEKADNSNSVMRIPQQCIAGTEEEFDWESSGRLQFPGKLHKDLGENDNDTCVLGLHVGCARWGVPSKPYLQHVYWYP
jgi:hypothetical protein